MPRLDLLLADTTGHVMCIGFPHLLAPFILERFTRLTARELVHRPVGNYDIDLKGLSIPPQKRDVLVRHLDLGRGGRWVL